MATAKVYSALQAKTVARAVIILYKAGEGSVSDILDSYNLSQDNRTLVAAQIVALDGTIPLS